MAKYFEDRPFSKFGNIQKKLFLMAGKGTLVFFSAAPSTMSRREMREAIEKLRGEIEELKKDRDDLAALLLDATRIIETNNM